MPVNHKRRHAMDGSGKSLARKSDRSRRKILRLNPFAPGGGLPEMRQNDGRLKERRRDYDPWRTIKMDHAHGED